MQLNEILEENSIKSISQKTKISESNLENLIAGKFEALQKTKALGFIAIIEREYHADLGKLREDAQEYYGAHKEDYTFGTRHYIDEEKKGKSRFMTLVVLGLLVYASWYFLTQFDKKNLSGLIPFIDEAKIESIIKSDEEQSVEDAEDLSIAKVTVENKEEVPAKKEEIVEEPESQNVSTDEESVEEVETPEQNISQAFLQSILIEPVNRLWFGLVNAETKERKHFSIDEGYVIEVGEKRWLVATSSAPFALVQGDNIQEFNDAREHYFRIDKHGVVMLNKNEYVEQGGWHQW